MLKIDMHSHIIPATLPKWTDQFGYGDFISLRDVNSGTKDMFKGEKFFRRIEENCWNEELRIKEYREHNTDVQVICTIPVLFSYWAKPKDGLKTSQFLNDHIADIVNRFPKNYIGLGTLPMQAPELAIQELRRCKEIGLVGVEIGTNINDKNLSEQEFFPIYEACEDLEMSLLVHPWNMMGFHQIEKYWLPWLVSMPAETSRAVCSMIFSGVFEKFPKLRTCFCHAGGSFFATLGRIDHGFDSRPDLCAIDNNVRPSNYLNKFWIDSITHDIEALEFILKKQNSNKVCLGSDYPFPLGDLEIGKFIEDSELAQKTKADILYQSTLDWLNLKEKDFI